MSTIVTYQKNAQGICIEISRVDVQSADPVIALTKDDLLLLAKSAGKDQSADLAAVIAAWPGK